MRLPQPRPSLECPSPLSTAGTPTPPHQHARLTGRPSSPGNLVCEQWGCCGEAVLLQAPPQSSDIDVTESCGGLGFPDPGPHVHSCRWAPSWPTASGGFSGTCRFRDQGATWPALGPQLRPLRGPRGSSEGSRCAWGRSCASSHDGPGRRWPDFASSFHFVNVAENTDLL